MPMTQPAARAAAPHKAKGRRGGLWTVLQFVVGLAVIVGVAWAVVALYIRYYQ